MFASRQDPAAHPFTQKYLHSSFSFEVAPGVGVELPVGRDSVGLMLAELHQEAGNLAATIQVVELLEPTTYAAVSLAELCSQAGRHADVVEVTEEVSNQDVVHGAKYRCLPICPLYGQYVGHHDEPRWDKADGRATRREGLHA